MQDIHTCPAVARSPLRQLGFLVVDGRNISTFPNSWYFFTFQTFIKEFSEWVSNNISQFIDDSWMD